MTALDKIRLIGLLRRSPASAGLLYFRAVVTAAHEPDLKGYEIVWRPTTAPDWTHVVAVGKRTRYTLQKLSKDNVYFGVRAVDTTGHRSPVAFPAPDEG
jgi:hypothetical protein